MIVSKLSISAKNECTSCGKIFIRSNNLKLHILYVHEGHRDYKCESCGKSFARAEHLKKHIHTVHEGHKDYKCESCGKSFSDKSNLKKHIHTVHEGHKDYKCESCGKSFTKAVSLKKHIESCLRKKKEQTEEEINLFCDICNLKFANKPSYAGHIRRKHSKRPKHFICDICGWKQETGDITTFKRHVANHNKDQTCDLCDFKYATKSDLTHHMRNKHPSDPESLKCNQCQSVFTAVNSLKSHVKRVHIDKTATQCHHCGKQYDSSSGLKYHIETKHEGKKKFSCHLCDLTFKLKHSMNKHIKVSHEGQCPYCEYIPGPSGKNKASNM